MKPKVSRRKEIIQIRVEINEIHIKKTIEKINENRSWFFEKINKIETPLARLTKKKRQKALINKIRNKRGEITMDTKETQKVRKEYCQKIGQPRRSG